MPLGPDLSDQLIGPLGVLGASWVLPPWCEKHQHQLHQNAQHVAFASNSEDGAQSGAFVPLCYTGTFGRVQFFWPKVDNVLGLQPGITVAVKYQDVPLKEQKAVDREIELLHECAGDHVVPLYTVSRQERESWMVMPFVGYNLRTTLMQPMSDAEAASIFLQLVQGVKDMHSKDVLHRDLKLENVLVAHDAKGVSVLIGDLGHACGGAEQWSRDNFGTTLEYAAPEIWEQGLVPAGQRDAVRQRESCSLANTYGEATDIWAVAVMLLQIVLRTVYIPGVMESKVISPFVMYLGVLNLAGKIEELIEAAGYLPEPVKEILRIGLQRNAEQRLGPQRVGIEYILCLAKEWDAKCKMKVEPLHRTNTTRVMDLFKSTTNEAIHQERCLGQLPCTFASPSGHLTLPVDAKSKWKADVWQEQCFNAALSPGSMV